MAKKKAVKKTNGAGRPTKYTPDMDKKAEDYLAQGFSKFAVCGLLDITEDTLYQWIKKNERFSEAIKRGTSKSQLFFEKCMIAKTSGQRIDGIDPRNVDTSCTVFALKTRFHKTFGEKEEKATASVSVKVYGNEAGL